MAERLTVGQGQFELERWPPQPLLRAWDAADEYLLGHLAEARPPLAARVLLVNDAFGALAVALHAHQPTAVSDSYLSQQATRLNWAANRLPVDNLTLLSSLDTPAGQFDWVLLKVPKTLALLEDQLIRLRPCLKPCTQIRVAAMVKALPASVWPLLERHWGPTRTLLAQKKARLIVVDPDLDKPPAANPYPVVYTLEGTGHPISSHANVFARTGLDMGTRLLLRHVPTSAAALTIVDLGCGNGVLGLLAAERNPQASLWFVDESHMAVASAQANFRRAFAHSRTASFKVGDGADGLAAASVDLVLCNPPFHQQQAITSGVAVAMFNGARRVLRAGGELWVVGNRHLGYHLTLRRVFGNCQLVASNPKFVVLRCRR